MIPSYSRGDKYLHEIHLLKKPEMNFSGKKNQREYEYGSK
jgi:hypothetical protein